MEISSAICFGWGSEGTARGGGGGGGLQPNPNYPNKHVQTLTLIILYK
jgi:hypothetical protein